MRSKVTDEYTCGDTRTDMPLWALTVRAVHRYLSVTEVADKAGLSRNTVKAYSQFPGRLPEPDAMIGRVRGWLPETIEAWMARRGGR